MAIVTTILSSNLTDCGSRDSFGGSVNTRVYEVVASILDGTTRYVDTELVLLKNYSLAPNFAFPVKGVIHPFDTTKVCSDVEIKWVPRTQGVGGAGADQYTVTATYTTIVPGILDLSVHPLSRAPEISVKSYEEMHTPDKDADGNYYKNSVGDQYINTPALPKRGLERWDITWNTYGAELDDLRALKKTTNNATWNSASAGTVALDDMYFSRVTEDWQGQVITYWRVTISLIAAASAELLRDYLVDQGFNHYTITGGPTKRKNLDVDGTEYPTPQYLNGSGSVSSTGQITIVTSPVIFPSNGFARYKSSDWSSATWPSFVFNTDLTPT